MARLLAGALKQGKMVRIRYAHSSALDISALTIELEE